MRTCGGCYGGASERVHGRVDAHSRDPSSTLHSHRGGSRGGIYRDQEYGTREAAQERREGEGGRSGSGRETMICPNCGGKLIGDGMRTPVQCEFVEVPADVEVDAGPFYCAPKFTPGPWSINTAAAPELYKALRYLVSAIDFEGETQHYDSVYCLCVEQARDAIAKAEGRSDE
jgi:hypothetical protein